MNQLTQLEQIVTLSETMLKDAENGDWECVIEMRDKREQLIESCFPVEETCADPAGMRQRLSHVIALDGQVMALAKQQQKDLGKALSDLNVGRQATAAYKKMSS